MNNLFNWFSLILIAIAIDSNKIKKGIKRSWILRGKMCNQVVKKIWHGESKGKQ